MKYGVELCVVVFKVTKEKGGAACNYFYPGVAYPDIPLDQT
jgi:hypothetical protein